MTRQPTIRTESGRLLKIAMIAVAGLGADLRANAKDKPPAPDLIKKLEAASEDTRPLLALDFLKDNKNRW